MGQQEAHFDAIEAESDADVMRKLNRCFVREGRSQCGSVRQILGRDVFGGTSDVNSDCPVCGGIIESTTKDYLSHPKRECISQAFLDEVSVRLQRCTGGAITQMADPDAAATRHYPALKKSITVGVSWRHQLDECRLSGKTRWAARVDKCMARRRPLCTYCKHVSGSCFNSKGGQCKKYAQRQAGQLCRCFFDNRPSLMEALKRVVAIVAKRQKDKGVKGWDVKEDCENVLRSEFEGMKAYGAGKLEINWLAIYEAAVDKCVDKKIDAVNANINFGCVLTQVEFQPKERKKLWHSLAMPLISTAPSQTLTECLCVQM